MSTVVDRDPFDVIRAAFRAGAAEPASACGAAIHRRLLASLGRRGGAACAGPADRAALLRHVLRREELRQGGTQQTLLLRSGEPWPDGAAWDGYGVEALHAGPGELRVRAHPWRPPWLPDADRSPVGESAFAGETRRTFVSVAGDPFLTEIGHAAYRCEAQRQMVHAVLTAEPGSTLLLNLPTGAGKSLCALLPALLTSRGEGTSVIVVPTTALALDQELGLRERVSHATAYHAGGGAEGESRRAGIRRRIEEGTQRVVFCSPESVAGALRDTLRRAAGEDRLRYLVMDEAHVVDEWGSEFRSEFQALAGIRRDLLRACGGPAFRTLLMTATLTEACLDTLDTLFGCDGGFEVLSAVQLRPEPEYWSAWCDSEETRIARVMEAVRHLPRPLILYTTRVAHAEQWEARLRAVGFRRCATVTGATEADRRARVIGQWRAGELDVICATSAFGLGMDQGEVRTVIHACVPESVDRFYQEVGRAGRDGAACVSVVVYTSQDLADAERMSQRKLITPDKGLPRWRRMFEEATPLGGGRYRVPVDVSPGVDVERLDMQGERNEAWNVRTLTLMARARLLELDAEPGAAADDSGAETGATRVVRILDEDHRDAATWARRVQPLRQRSYASGEESVRRLRELLSGRRCAADVFAEAYTLRPRSPEVPGTGVSRCCSGCPACRAAGTPPRRTGLPVPTPRAAAPRIVEPELARLFDSGDTLAVFDGAWERFGTERLYRWLVTLGVRALVLPPELPPERRVPFERVLGAGEIVFVSDRFVRRRAPRVPTLIVHAPGAPVPAHHLPDGRGAHEGFPRILFLPHDAADPVNDGRLLRDVISCPSYQLGELLASRSL
jgi:ATP-dependent DNA helicase RecQ